MNDLEFKSEITEKKALKSLHECCPPELKASLGLEKDDFSGVMVSSCKSDPSILLNRAVGLGSDAPAIPDLIGAVTGRYASLGIDDYFFHVYDEDLDENGRKMLASLGLHRRRGWMKFVNKEPAGRKVDTTLTVEKADPYQAEDFGAIVCRSFGLKDISIPLIAALRNDDRWHLFLSHDGGTPAGSGGLFVDGEFGWLDWAATDSAYRCRGSQSAIMAARLDLAASLGCKYVFTETGEAVQGDPQHSYGNIRKAGFRELALRANYSPQPAP